MRTVTLELGHIDTVAALHIYLQYRLGLPAHYGRNLDALHDALGEIAQDTHIVLCTRDAGGETAAFLPRLQRVLQDAARENPHVHISCESSITSDGPIKTALQKPACIL